MNKELLNQLAHQASFWCDQNIPEQFSEEIMGYGEAWEEKFAELIVKECMAQCDKVEHDDELSNHEGGFRDGALLCYQEIRDHFGVEE